MSDSRRGRYNRKRQKNKKKKKKKKKKKRKWNKKKRKKKKNKKKGEEEEGEDDEEEWEDDNGEIERKREDRTIAAWQALWSTGTQAGENAVAKPPGADSPASLSSPFPFPSSALNTVPLRWPTPSV